MSGWQSLRFAHACREWNINADYHDEGKPWWHWRNTPNAALHRCPGRYLRVYLPGTHKFARRCT